MSNGFSTTTLAASVGISLVVGGGIGYELAVAQMERKEINVLLQTVGQRCRAQNPLTLRSLHKKKLTWHINNQCGSPQVVELRNFAPRDDNGTVGQPESGVFPNDVVNRSQPFGPGTQGNDLEATPTKEVDRDRTYKYAIIVAPNTPNAEITDPDIDWWK